MVSCRADWSFRKLTIMNNVFKCLLIIFQATCKAMYGYPLPTIDWYIDDPSRQVKTTFHTDIYNLRNL